MCTLNHVYIYLYTEAMAVLSGSAKNLNTYQRNPEILQLPQKESDIVPEIRKE